MKPLALYALEVLVCSGVLLAAYSLLLERRAAFRWCRAYLLASTLLAGIIPLLRIPVWPGRVIETVPTVALPAADWTAEVVEEAAPAVTPETVCLAVYLLGAGLIAGVAIAQAVRIRRLRRGAKITRTEHFTLVRTPRQIASFSFFRSIYVWESTPAEELPAIVAHETSHIAHRHSFERVGMECLKAAMWWNPFVWIAARRLTEAEEFEADSDVLAGGYDIEHYMKTIFRQLFGYSPEIANGLRDSLTKKRFKMMTTKTSGRHTLLRLAGTLPAVTGLLCAFSFTVRAEEIRIPETEKTPADNVATSSDKAEKEISVTVTKDGKPLSGAIVLITGTHTGTVTDTQGKARISAAPGSELAVSYVGCKTEKIRVSDTAGAETHTLTLTTADNRVDAISVTPGDKQPDAATPASPDHDKDEPFLIAEVMPSFRGGDLNAFRTWVQGEVRYPIEAIQQNIQGRIIATFIIEKDGSINQIEVLQSPSESFSKEVRRVLESSPEGAWTPGMQRGKNVRVKYTIPIDFRINNDSQPTLPAVDKDEPFLIAEVMPSFRGGDLNAFRVWVQQQIRYPAEAMQKKIQGRVVTSFTILEDGSLGDIHVLRSPDKLLSDETVRAIGTSPAGAWSPGEQRGQKVKVKYTLPIDFRLQGVEAETSQPAGKPEPNSLGEIVVVGYSAPAE